MLVPVSDGLLPSALLVQAIHEDKSSLQVRRDRSKPPIHVGRSSRVQAYEYHDHVKQTDPRVAVWDNLGFQCIAGPPYNKNLGRGHPAQAWLAHDMFSTRCIRQFAEFSSSPHCQCIKTPGQTYWRDSSTTWPLLGRMILHSTVFLEGPVMMC